MRLISLFVVVYTVEFQKRGLPHAHILLFFHPEDKHKSGTDIDKIIIAEIPDKEAYPKLYDAFKNYMMVHAVKLDLTHHA